MRCPKTSQLPGKTPDSFFNTYVDNMKKGGFTTEVVTGDVPDTLGKNSSLGTHFFLWGCPLMDVFFPRGQGHPLRDMFVTRVTGTSPYLVNWGII